MRPLVIGCNTGLRKATLTIRGPTPAKCQVAAVMEQSAPELELQKQ
jgi:hypothetical protein